MSRMPPHRIAALLALGLLGCEPSPIVSTGLALALDGCIEPDEAPAGCRARLQAVAPAGTAACLVVVPAGDDARIARIPFLWQDTRLVPAEPDAAVAFSVDENLEASLFVLSADAGGCDGLALRDACLGGEGCIARYGPVGRAPNPSGVTALDFVRSGVCVVELAPRHQVLFPEICGDAIDNDCDGLSDEDIIGVCQAGVGACAAAGERQVCRGDGYACDALPGSPEADVTCDGIDDDCDGMVDESGDCSGCLFDNECLGTPETSQCVDGRCEACDPATGDGCDDSAPICDPDSATCRPCAADAECGPGRVCAVGRCHACDPTRPAATCPDRAEPVCDTDAFACRPCHDGSECVSGICFGGRCARCDPVTHVGCLAPTIFCDVNDLSCRACAVDSECARVDPTLPVCLDGVCAECDPAGNVGCGDPNRPICASDSPDAQPTCGVCEADEQCAPLQCRNGRCVGCDPIDNSGCDPLGGQPVCDESDPGDAVCRPCAQDAECPGGLGRGICNAGRCMACGDDDARGCAEEGDEPICVGGRCRPCLGDGECGVRPGSLDVCVGGRCGACDPDGNRGCGGDTPVCGAAGCRPCGADAECGDRQCVGGRCLVCDPATHDGCPVDRPICGAGGGACEPCREDQQCDGGRLCVAGRCLACDPGDGDGCDPTSITPICDPQSAMCVRCSRDPQCDGRQCLADGRCADCDPADNAGCVVGSDRPICGPGGTCSGCQADADCTSRGLGQVCELGTGRCRACVAAGNRGCDPQGAAPICRDGGCQSCREDVECGAGQVCSEGRCVGCTPQGNVGCDPLGGAPICAGGVCRACQVDGECQDPQRPYCVGGTCSPCNPANGAGCDAGSDRPLCVAGQCVGCGADPAACERIDDQRPECLGDGRCAPCNPDGNAGCDPDGASPVCDAGVLFCRACFADAECTLGNCDLFAGGRCVRCDPAAEDTGCDPGSGSPVCDPQTLRCVPCIADAECADNPEGILCRDGSCGCTPGDNSTCPNDNFQPICSNSLQTCRRCNNDRECGGNQRCRNGGECR